MDLPRKSRLSVSITQSCIAVYAFDPYDAWAQAKFVSYLTVSSYLTCRPKFLVLIRLDRFAVSNGELRNEYKTSAKTILKHARRVQRSEASAKLWPWCTWHSACLWPACRQWWRYQRSTSTCCTSTPVCRRLAQACTSIRQPPTTHTVSTRNG